jgi:hypothetical protein
MIVSSLTHVHAHPARATLHTHDFRYVAIPLVNTFNEPLDYSRRNAACHLALVHRSNDRSASGVIDFYIEGYAWA